MCLQHFILKLCDLNEKMQVIALYFKRDDDAGNVFDD